MSTYVLMRILESAPRRYDLGVRLLTLGRVDRAYERLVSHVEPGQRVLDLGCGTGALTVRAARRGAYVRGIDINPEMLAIAHQRVEDAGLGGRVELAEAGVAELDAEPASAFDTVMSGLCLSELSDDELGYTLTQVARLLKPDGQLLVADEIRPRNLALRVVHGLVRAPLVVLTYVLTQQTTHPLRGLPARLEAAGLTLLNESAAALGSLGVFVARKPTSRRR